MRLKDCYNINDFRRLAKQQLPSPIFHYIDGGADDEVTLNRNTASFNDRDLIPNVLTGIQEVDLSTEVLGQKLELPLIFAPTALQRLFHYQGERATAKVAEQFGTLYGISTVGTCSIEEMGSYTSGPKLFQIYVHRDDKLNHDLIERCKVANFDALALTVDTIVAGNRERDRVTGMSTPPKLTIKSALSFATHPQWTLNYLLREPFDLPNVSRYVEDGSNIKSSIIEYINNQLSPCISWDDAAAMIEQWGKPFAIKGVMSVDDAKKAVQIGASAIMVSNHGGRQLDGSRAPFDQLEEIVQAVGGQIEIILDSGIRRGTHVLKALALGANACSGGRLYLYALAGAGQAGMERAVMLMKEEIERDMMLMGCHSIAQLKPSMLAWRS